MAAALSRGAEGDGTGPRPPSSQLPSIPACPICLESFDPELSEVFSCCPCGHTFHRLCIRRWQRMPRKSNVLPTCPVCRAETRLESIHQIHFNIHDLGGVGGRCKGKSGDDYRIDAVVETRLALHLDLEKKRFNDMIREKDQVLAKAKAQEKGWRSQHANVLRDLDALKIRMQYSEHDLSVAQWERDDNAFRLESAEKEIENWKICNDLTERASREATRLLRKSTAELAAKTKELDEVKGAVKQKMDVVLKEIREAKKAAADAEAAMVEEQLRLNNSASFFFRRLDFENAQVAALQKERDTFLRQRDELAVEKKELQSQIDSLLELQRDKDHLHGRRIELQRERDDLRLAREELLKENERLQMERFDLVTENDKLRDEQATLVKERNVLTGEVAEKDLALTKQRVTMEVREALIRGSAFHFKTFLKCLHVLGEDVGESADGKPVYENVEVNDDDDAGDVRIDPDGYSAVANESDDKDGVGKLNEAHRGREALAGSDTSCRNVGACLDDKFVEDGRLTDTACEKGGLDDLDEMVDQLKDELSRSRKRIQVLESVRRDVEALFV